MWPVRGNFHVFHIRSGLLGFSAALCTPHEGVVVVVASAALILLLVVVAWLCLQMEGEVKSRRAAIAFHLVAVLDEKRSVEENKSWACRGLRQREGSAVRSMCVCRSRNLFFFVSLNSFT